MPLKSLIRTIPHYPKHGVMFRDITTLLRDADGFNSTISQFVDRYRDENIETVAGIEARGFIIGAAIASQLGTGFVPIRKTNKLPGERIGQEYALEYGVDRLELHTDAISAGQRVLLVDDLIATGGTAEASIKLIEQVGGRVVEACFVIDLPELGGRRRIEAMGHGVFSLCEFEGE
jgi:adenine phosphoribosyltransferase